MRREQKDGTSEGTRKKMCVGVYRRPLTTMKVWPRKQYRITVPNITGKYCPFTCYFGS